MKVHYIAHNSRAIEEAWTLRTLQVLVVGGHLNSGIILNYKQHGLRLRRKCCVSCGFATRHWAATLCPNILLDCLTKFSPPTICNASFKIIKHACSSGIGLHEC